MLRFSLPSRRILALTAVAILTCATLAIAGGDLRTWSDATGKFKIEAKFISQDKGTVTLEGKDGKQFQIEASKLSPADQKLLAELAKKTPTDDPFKSAPGNSKGTAKTIATNWKSAPLISTVPATTTWQIPVKPSVAAKVAPTPIALPIRATILDDAKSLVMSPTGNRAAVTIHFKKGKDQASSVLAFDLVKGKTTGALALPGSMTALAVNDDGTQVVMRADGKGTVHSERLEIWSISEKGGTKLLEFTPYDSEKTRDRDVYSADFLDGNRLMTSNGHGRLVVWDMGAGKALYHMAFQGGTTVSLSPDRSMLGFTTGKEIGILDLDAGKVLATAPTPSRILSAMLAWSPDGRLLALANSDRIYIWNVADGGLYREIATKGVQVGAAKGLLWTSEKNLLLSGSHLYDIEAQMRYWEYKGHSAAQTSGGLTWFVNYGKPSSLMPSPIPHPEAQQALAKALTDPNFIVLKAGTTVKLDVSGLPNVGEREKVSRALQAKLEKNGCKVSPTGTIELIASTEIGNQRELAFANMPANTGKFPGKTKGAPAPTGPIRLASIEEHYSKLKFVHQGTTVWESSGHNIPTSVKLLEGETLEQHLKKLERPNYAFYDKVDLPRLLIRAKGTNALGASKVSAAGIR